MWEHKKDQKDAMWKGFDLELLALKMEEGDHKPGNKGSQ